jgi:endonuclease YncB( thermonuclease family)
MKKTALALIWAIALAGPAWAQDSLAEKWTKAKDATAEALSKTADAASESAGNAWDATKGAVGKAKDATVEAAGKAKDATAGAVEKVKGKVRPAPKEFQATVLQVADGDTIVVRTADHEQVKIRLYGIDAPESKQKGGAEATAALKPLQGKTVKVVEMDTDQDVRTVDMNVALVEHEGRSVNLDQVAQGHAWHYGKYCKDEPICGQIQAAETEARKEKRGIWAGEPVAPWEWRSKQ